MKIFCVKSNELGTIYCKWLGARRKAKMNTNNNTSVVENNSQKNQEMGANVQIPKTFDEMLKEFNYQSEFDKKIQKSLETAKIKWEAEQLEKQSEAEKLAKMKEAERSAYELEQARKKQEEAEAKLNAYELKEEAIKIANSPETQVDVSLLDLVNFKTIKAEQVESVIKNIKSVFDSAVEREVNRRLKEATPKTVSSYNNQTEKERKSRISI